MGQTNYYSNVKISDTDIVQVLDKISDKIGKIWVTSGDRGHVPKGGSKTSRHLHHMAADFVPEAFLPVMKEKFKIIFNNRNLIFTTGHRYEFIWHGEHTNTGGSHFHIGRFSKGTGVNFRVEGLTKETSGKYTEYQLLSSERSNITHSYSDGRGGQVMSP